MPKTKVTRGKGGSPPPFPSPRKEGGGYRTANTKGTAEKRLGAQKRAAGKNSTRS